MCGVHTRVFSLKYDGGMMRYMQSWYTTRRTPSPIFGEIFGSAVYETFSKVECMIIIFEQENVINCNYMRKVLLENKQVIFVWKIFAKHQRNISK
jgi:hypothetical protein